MILLHIDSKANSVWCTYYNKWIVAPIDNKLMATMYYSR